MESMNDEEDADIINCEEDQDQPHVRVASLEKLVDYCAEEFSKFSVLLLARRFVCFWCIGDHGMLKQFVAFVFGQE